MEVLDDMGFKSIIADPDIWICPLVNPDCEQYYEYVLVYVYDILVMSFF